MANFYRIGAGGLNWSNVGSWSSTSGGASNGSAEPTSSDAVFFDTNSPATVTVTSAASGLSCSLTKSGLTITLNGGSVTISGTTTIANNAQVINKTTSETWSTSGFTASGTSISGTAKLIFTGGTWSATNTNSHISNDIDLQGNVTVSGNVYYRVGILAYISGSITTTSSTLNLQGNMTLNTSGVTWNNVASNTSTNTITLTSNFLVGGTTTISTSTTINHTTAETWSTNGIAVNSTASGTAKVILTGGTWSGSNTTGIANDLDLQGNITVSGNVYYRTGTLRYVSGTITVTSSTLNITGSCTLNTNGMSWNNVTINSASSTITLTSNLSQTGLLNIPATTTINKTTSETWTTSGGLTVNANVGGTIDLYLSGGTWQHGAVTNRNLSVNLFIQGNVTLGAIAVWGANSKTFTYISGTVDTTTNNSVFYIYGAGTIDSAGINWYRVVSSNAIGNFTITLTSLLNVTNIFEIQNGPTFAGTAGFTCATLLCDLVSAATISFKESVTYTITSLFDCHKSRLGSIVLFTSSHASTKANILMPNNGNNSCNILASFTRIDASGGRTIMTYGGTVTDCININSFTDKLYGVAA